MFCQNCGNKIETIGRYCPHCGAVLNSLPAAQQIRTNVNYDYTLPKNNNFMYTIMFVLFLLFIGFVYLGNYHKEYDYNVSIDYHDYKVYLPIGFKTTLGDGDEEKEEDKEIYIFNDEVKYSVQDFNDYYSRYRDNDFSQTKKLLTLRGYDVIDTKEVKYDNKGMILSKFKMGEDTLYFYIYDYSDNDIVFSGFMYTKDDEDNDLITNTERLYKILSNIKE